jgi:hypothetical protein
LLEPIILMIPLTFRQGQAYLFLCEQAILLYRSILGSTFQLIDSGINRTQGSSLMKILYNLISNDTPIQQ